MSQWRPNCPSDMNENNEVNDDIYLSVLEWCNVALLWVFVARSIFPAKLDEIGRFEPQRLTGIFGALVSNDRAAEWVEGE